MRAFLTFIRAIVAGDDRAVRDQLAADPSLATTAYRSKAPSLFYKDIAHYMYGGDTALHMAAAASRPAIVRMLIAKGANIHAANRRGAGAIHYAADGHHDAATQASTISALISAGADPNAADKSGVAPLHRAVRNRSAAAVRALLDGGADINLKNRSGSTPLFLARHNTGKSGSGSATALEQRAAIEAFLIGHGAEE